MSLFCVFGVLISLYLPLHLVFHIQSGFATKFPSTQTKSNGYFDEKKNISMVKFIRKDMKALGCISLGTHTHTHTHAYTYMYIYTRHFMEINEIGNQLKMQINEHYGVDIEIECVIF